MKESTLTILNNLEVQTPCHQPWNTMKANGETRFCDQCQESVYDLSKMTRKQAKQLIEEQHESCCIRITRDDRGDIIYDDRNWFQKVLMSRLQTTFSIIPGLILSLVPGFTSAEAPASRILPEAEHEVSIPNRGHCPAAGSKVTVIWHQPDGWFTKKTILARALTLLRCTPHKEAIVRASSHDADTISRVLDHDAGIVSVNDNEVVIDPPRPGVIMGKMVAIDKSRTH